MQCNAMPCHAMPCNAMQAIKMLRLLRLTKFFRWLNSTLGSYAKAVKVRSSNHAQCKPWLVTMANAMGQPVSTNFPPTWRLPMIVHTVRDMLLTLTRRSRLPAPPALRPR